MAYAAASKQILGKRNILQKEIDDILETLKNDMAPVAYVFEINEREIIGLVHNIKEINREFRTIISDKGLLSNDEFIADQIAINEKYQSIYKELATCKERVTKVEMQAIGGDQIHTDKLGEVIGEAIDKLSTTLTENVKEINTDRINPKIKRPYFDGTGKNVAENFEEFWEQFLNYVKGVKRNARKLEHLRDSLGGTAKNLVIKYPLEDANFELAKKSLDDLYQDKDITRIKLLDDIIYSSWCKTPINKLHETVTEWLISITKLKDKYEIDLLADKYNKMTADILLKKLDKNVKSKIVDHLNNDYPEMNKIVESIPIIIKRMSEAQSPGQNRACNNVSEMNEISEYAITETNSNFYGGQPIKNFSNRNYGNNSYRNGQNVQNNQLICWFCNGSHRAVHCEKFPTVTMRQNNLIDKDRCVKCLRRRHDSERCEVIVSCKICNKLGHNNLFCKLALGKLKANSKKELRDYMNGDNKVKTSANVSQKLANVALPTVWATVGQINGTKANTHVLLDQGSQSSLISEKLARELKLKSLSSIMLSIQGINTNSGLKKHNVYEIFVETNEGDVNMKVIEMASLPCVNMPGYSDIAESLVNSGKDVADLNIKTDNVKVDLLIGSDYYNEIIKNEKSEIFDTMRLLPSKMGYIPYGAYQTKNGEHTSNNMLTVLKIGKNIEIVVENEYKKNIEKNRILDPRESMARLFALDSMGIKDSELDINDDKILQYFEENAHYDTVRKQYSVPLLFKQWPPEKLPSNRNLAFQRFNQLKTQIQKNPTMAKDLQNLCINERKNGFIEEVPKDEVKKAKCHYLAALLVSRPGHPTTPLRRVWDASAKVKGGTSLNENLYAGPNMVPKIFNIIMRCRYFKYFLLSDISKAFLRLILNKEYRDYTRLNIKENWEDMSSKDLLYRFKTILFGSTSSPFLLQATINLHLKRIQAQHLTENLFVDDVSFFSNNIQELISYKEQAIKAFSLISMPLSKYATNSVELNEKFLNENIIDKIPEVVKLLGMKIDINKDLFLITKPNFTVKNATLRTVVSNCAEIWDVPGIMMPIHVKAKLFISSLHKRQLQWDDMINNEEINEWKEIIYLYESNYIHGYDRCVVTQTEAPLLLCIFCDSSQQAFGCVGYVVTLGKEKTSKFLCSKSKIKPLGKKMSIPKLELCAFVLGLELIKTLKENSNQIKFKETHIFSDASCVLNWTISNKVHTNRFIYNRTNTSKEIIRDQNVILHHIEGTKNPADYITKNFDKQYDENKLWNKGPRMLIDSDKWKVFSETEDWGEEKITLDNDIYVGNIGCETNKMILPDPNRFGNLLKLYGATFNLIQFCKYVKSLLKIGNVYNVIDKNLTVEKFGWLLSKTNKQIWNTDQLNKINKIWIKEVQKIFEKIATYFKSQKNYRESKENL